MFKNSKLGSFSTKVILFVVILALGLSGVSQVFMNKSSNTYVAQVGNRKISIEQYRKMYDIEKNNIQNMTNMSFSNEQLKSLGLPKIVLEKLIKSLLLENLIKNLKLKIGDKSFADTLQKIKYFHNEEGKFDKDKLLFLLRHNNLSEAKYIAETKELIMKEMAVDAFKYTPFFSTETAEILYKSKYEQRIVDVHTFTKDMVKNIPTPMLEELKNFYKTHKKIFKSPEYRIAEYIFINKNNINESITADKEVVSEMLAMTEDRIDVSYVSVKDSDSTQLVLDTLKEKNISTIKEHKVLNNLSKDTLPEKLQTIFLLEEGEISPPIKTTSGLYIFQINKKYKISEEEKSVLEKEIEQEMINQKINEKLEDLVKNLEEKLLSGITMEDLISSYNLQVQSIGPIDINHDSATLTKLIFDQESKTEYDKSFSNLIDENGLEEYYNVKVTKIIPEKFKNFEECEDEVRNAWEQDFISKELNRIASEVNIDKSNLEQKTIFRTKTANTEAPQQDYPESFVDQIFKLQKGESTLPVKYKNSKLIRGTLIEIEEAKRNKILTQEIEKELNEILLETMLQDFEQYLRRKSPVSINEEAIAYLISN